VYRTKIKLQLHFRSTAAAFRPANVMQTQPCRSSCSALQDCSLQAKHCSCYCDERPHTKSAHPAAAAALLLWLVSTEVS
jgi:hypothetical protein